jgi:hypothetical protein
VLESGLAAGGVCVSSWLSCGVPMATAAGAAFRWCVQLEKEFFEMTA